MKPHPGLVPRWVRLLAVLLLVEVVVFVASTVPGVRSSSGFDPWIDGWLQGAGYVTAALLALTRSSGRSPDRAGWNWIAAALVARALGFGLYLAVVRLQTPIPYPSIADAARLAVYPLLIVGLVLLVRCRARLMTTSLALDGAVVAFAAAAVAVSLLDPSSTSVAAHGLPAGVAAVDLACPVLDVMLLVVVAGAVLLSGPRHPPGMWALAVGVAGFAAVDGVFLYQAAMGDFRQGDAAQLGGAGAHGRRLRRRLAARCPRRATRPP